MSDQNKEKLEAIQVEAQNLLEEIKRFRTQAETEFKAAEAARKNADSEGLFAINAKKTCEDHSTAISQLKGTVEVDVNSIKTNKQTADELLAAITLEKATADADTQTLSDRRKSIERASGEIIEASEKGVARLQKIDESKDSADAFLKETEQMRDSAIEARDKTKTAQSRIEQLSTQAVELETKITEAHETSTQLSGEIDALLTAAKTDQVNLKEILDRLTKSHETASEFEARVIKSSEDLKSLIKKTEDLLPGVTSASLASAFGEHKKRFKIPKIAWVVTFVLCIAGLLLVAYPSFRAAVSEKPLEKTWEEILRSFVMRLPIVIPLVWLAIYAGRNYMLSIRLEEDYAYKEAISITFEGYKREMEKIAGEQAPGPNNPITTLCVNVLKAIAERPGRIYESRQQDITLANEVNGALEKAAELSKKQLASR